MVESSPPQSNYWLRRARQQKEAMLLSGEVGLFQWTVDISGKPDRFRNVVEHELVEAEVVDVLGELMGCSSEQRQMLRSAAMMHDIWKRHQREAIDQAPQEEKEKAQDQAFANQEQFLRTKRIPEEIIRLTASVGHTSLLKFVKDPKAHPFQLQESVTLLMQIINYADLITLESNITTIDERIAAVNNRKKPYPEKGKGGDIFAGRTYSEAAQEVGHIIERNFVSSLIQRGEIWPEWIDKLRENPSELPFFIRDVIDKRIETFRPQVVDVGAY